MGSLRLTLCAGAVVAGALGVSASAACAADSGGVRVVPGEPAPGSDIHVRAKGCGGKQGTAASQAFVADAQLTQLGGAGVGTLTGETRVRSSLEPGTYDVRVSCDGKEDKVMGTIKVGDGKKPPVTKPVPSTSAPSEAVPSRPAPPRSAARKDSPPDTAPASPVAPVRAGGGGAAAGLAANPVDATESAGSRGSAESGDSSVPANSMDDTRHTGPGTPHTVIGLVLAGAAAVVVLARGARRGRGNR